MNNHSVKLIEHLAEAFPGWLDLLASLAPETVKIEVSGSWRSQCSLGS